MKQIAFFIALLMVLTGCFWESEDVREAKKQLWIVSDTITIDPNDTSVDDKIILDTNIDPRMRITQVSGTEMLELDELKYEDFKNGYAKVTGKTLTNVKSITVDFANKDSEYPNSSHQLQKFSVWDKTFAYNANAWYKVLDFWTNVYTFRSESIDWENSVLTLEVLVSENDDKLLSGNEKKQSLEDTIKNHEWETHEMIGTENNNVYANLPTWWAFWDVIKLWESSFTYSDIKWLEVNKDLFWNISCEKNSDTGNYIVSEFLGERQDSWYFWNTCRDIVKGKWISFYVIRLSWEHYYYEKHYLDTLHNFYGIYELEKGSWVDKDNIAEKNRELKAKNEDFSTTNIVDDLFKKIVE